MSIEKRPNRLIDESSPYLLQHAYNPVDWYPWGPKALGESRRSDKPILLSIGYSACHWCHVMERESFEDEETASLMNRLFINIKVDREERPDLDTIYMNYVQMTTGSGGWPLTVFLTPEQIPFFGGTYFPPRDQSGRPGFPRVLEQISDAYQNRRSELQAIAPEIVSRLEQAVQFRTPEAELGADIYGEAYDGLSKSFDHRNGGFGSAPKFPSSMVLAYLLRYHVRHRSGNALQMVEVSLREMAKGGMYDQLGGGFHRYSVDDRWQVPHFEKMLYDNALLVRLYLEAFQATGDTFYEGVAVDSLSYVTREMTGPEGGFYSAQDADSEGEEGRYFVWTKDEITEILGEQDAKIFCDFFGVTAAGNFEGRNILHARYELPAFARSLGKDRAVLETELVGWKRLLLQRREQRVKPGRDDKALASWNGLMLTAFSRAALVLGRSDLLETALNTARFLKSQMTTSGGRLCRTWKDGAVKLEAYLDDYAHVIEGYLHLFEVSGKVEWLTEAGRLMDLQVELFWDEQASDFYFTAADHEKLLVRQKEFMDNATPSGNSTSCFNLLRLGHLLGNERYRDWGRRLLKRTALAMARHPLAFGNWLQALDFYFGPLQEILVTGPPEERARLLEPVRRRFLPNTILVQSGGSVEKSILPMLEGRSNIREKSALHICQDNSCGLPMTDAAKIEARLAAMTGATE